MRVQTEEWQRFIPEVRMYKGKKTFFYNGDPLVQEIYEYDETSTWEVVIILPGVEVIPEFAFASCRSLKIVIMSDTVQRIEDEAFGHCEHLEFIRLSINIEFIGDSVFCECKSLRSLFIPPSCRTVGLNALKHCHKLIILVVHQDTQLDFEMMDLTPLEEIFLQEWYGSGNGSYNAVDLNHWIKNVNADEEFALHRACASFNPLVEIIYDIFKQQGPGAFQKRNKLGITPLEYLNVNPYADDLNQHGLLKKYILEMLGCSEIS